MASLQTAVLLLSRPSNLPLSRRDGGQRPRQRLHGVHFNRTPHCCTHSWQRACAVHVGPAGKPQEHNLGKSCYSDSEAGGTVSQKKARGGFPSGALGSVHVPESHRVESTLDLLVRNRKECPVHTETVHLSVPLQRLWPAFTGMQTQRPSHQQDGGNKVLLCPRYQT